jgi:hypothetical protein
VKLAIRCIVFAVIVGVLIFALNAVYTVTKTEYIGAWGDSSIVAGFYNEPKNSIDVLMFGTSTMSNAVQPAVLWNEQGFTSYNLSTERQYALSAYYMLLEALKYQQPKVVVLNARWLVAPPGGNSKVPEIDRDKAALHLALDYMKLSDVKIAAALDIGLNSVSQSPADYILPLYTYHSRDDITKEDFDLSFVSQRHPLKGSCIHLNANSITLGENMAKPGKASQVSGINPDYVGRIIDLCKSKGIEVLLLQVPISEWTRTHHETVRQYAQDMGVDFLDMNTAEVLDALQLDTDKDYLDIRHAAISGASKISRYLASYLAENYALGREYPREVAASFDDSSELYMSLTRACDQRFVLKRPTQLADYLAALADIEGCIVVISARDEFSTSLTSEQKGALTALGLTTDFYDDIYRYSYAAVIDSGSVVFEDCGPDRIEYAYISPEGISVSVTSAGLDVGNKSSVVIKGEEYSKNKRGLNIVVYNKKAGIVVDSVNFDTYTGADIVRG